MQHSLRNVYIFLIAPILLVLSLKSAVAQTDTPNMFTYVDVNTLSLADDQQRQLEKYQGDPKTSKLHSILLDLEQLGGSIPLGLNLPDQAPRVLGDIRIERREQGDFSWFGRHASSDDLGDEVILVVKDTEVYGTIRSRTELYGIRPLDQNTHVLIQIDQTAFPADHPTEFHEEMMQDIPPEESDDQGTSSRDSCSPIRAIVAYTTAAKGATNVDHLIQLAVDETNQGYMNSGIDTRVEIAHEFETHYKESGNLKTDVYRFAQKNDGHLDEIHSLRDHYHADVALLITESGNGCGRVKKIGGNADTAFAVVRQDCATGYYSFGHEIGHLQGAGHNPEAPTWSPFPYGHGYYYQPSSWRTVMAYNCPDGCTRLNHWSNPYRQRNGVAMGTTDKHHNSRVLNETACNVSSFR